MATLGAAFGIPFAMTRGGGGAKATKTPPINAGSKDEENFIQYDGLSGRHWIIRG